MQIGERAGGNSLTLLDPSGRVYASRPACKRKCAQGVLRRIFSNEPIREEPISALGQTIDRVQSLHL
jgi:hypothetical protein